MSFPERWQRVSIGESLGLINGRAFKPAEWSRTGSPIIRIQNLNNPEAHFNYYEGQLPEKFRVANGDLLFAWSGTPGTSFGAHLWRGEDAWLNQHIFRVTFSPDQFEKKFLQLAINQNLREYVRVAHGGAGLAHITKGVFESSILPAPPLNEQRKIVEKLEELFSELDAGVENLKKARAQLAVYRQALLKHAFEGKLTAEWRSLHRPVATVQSEIPHPVESWRFTTLGNLTEYITSGSRGWAEYYADSGPIFIRAANLNRDRLDLSEVAFVSLPAGVEGTRTQTRVGDVFVTITGANVTKAGYLDREIGESYVSQHVALCRPIDPTISEYLHLYIISNAGGRRDLEKAAYGAGKPGLNLDNLRTLQIPMPTRAEMPEIVAAIRSQLSEIDALEADIDQNLQRAEALRQSILKKAFAGELVPQDPADETTAALLARIRAEREAQAAVTKLPRTRTKKA